MAARSHFQPSSRDSGPDTKAKVAPKRPHDAISLEPVSLNLMPQQEARNRHFHQLEALEACEMSLCSMPTMCDPENIEPARETCSLCAVGCRRRAGHVGLCLTDHGLAPPSVKRRQSILSKKRHVIAQPFATLDLGSYRIDRSSGRGVADEAISRVRPVAHRVPSASLTTVLLQGSLTHLMVTDA